MHSPVTCNPVTHSPVAHSPALLVIAHGSRDPRHAATVHALVRRVRALRPALRVSTAFLDFNAPSVPQVLERMANDGVRDVVALPLLLTRAFHAKADIPAVLRDARTSHPRLRLTQAEVLGPSPLLLDALERRLYEAGLAPATALVRGTPDPTAAARRAGSPAGDSPGRREADRFKRSTGVVLAAAGSSDPEAIAVIARTARELRHTGWCAVRPAFASAALPRTEDAVRALRAEGVARVAVAPYVIAPGRLPDRIATGAESAGADILADVLGPSPELARLLLQRYAQACATPVLAATG